MYHIRGVHLKRKLRYTEIAGVVASWLLQCDQYVRQHPSRLVCGSCGACLDCMLPGVYGSHLHSSH